MSSVWYALRVKGRFEKGVDSQKQPVLLTPGVQFVVGAGRLPLPVISVDVLMRSVSVELDSLS
jgi:hypothetical protein